MCLISILVFGLAAGAADSKAGGRPSERPDMLGIYADAYSSSRIGFMCFPRAVPNGPAVPDYVRMQRALERRLARVAERLAAIEGQERIDAIEKKIFEGEHGIYRTGCDLNEARDTRLHYGRVLRRLEQLLDLRPGDR